MRTALPGSCRESPQGSSGPRTTGRLSRCPALRSRSNSRWARPSLSPYATLWPSSVLSGFRARPRHQTVGRTFHRGTSFVMSGLPSHQVKKRTQRPHHREPPPGHEVYRLNPGSESREKSSNLPDSGKPHEAFSRRLHANLPAPPSRATGP